MKKFYFIILPFMLLCLLGVYKALAQPASSYDYASGSLPFSYLSGSNPANRIETDDAVTLPVPIGFTFNFCGTDYTQVVVSSNGWLSFDNTTTASTPTNSSTNLLAIRPAVFPLWDDLSGAGGAASYLTLGTAPNRVFIFEFRNWKWNWNATAAGISFQVHLYEGVNGIQFRYKRESGALNSPTASIGIADEDGTFLSLNTSAAASSTGFTTNISGKPSSNTVFQFAPQQCTTPTPGATLASPATLACLGDYADLSISTPPAAVKTGNTYQWQSSPDNVTYTNISGATAKTYRATPAVATWYRCRVTCSFASSTVASTPVQVTFSGTAPAATNATRCGVGSVSLAASGGSGDTLRWYEDPLGGEALAEGTPFVTPTLTATTDYYVGAEQTSYDTTIIGAGADTTVSTGPSADKISPFDHGYGGTKMQYLLKASELTAMGMTAGDITSLVFDVVSGGTLYKGFKLSLRTTSATDLSSGTMMGGLTEVYATTSPAGLTTPASGLLEIPFFAPFTWNGTSNILVQTCWSNNNTGGTGSTVKYDTVAFTALNFYRADNKTPDEVCSATLVSGSRNIRPKISFIQTSVCSSPRKKVTATINTAPAFAVSDSLAVCNNSPAQLSVTSPLTSYTDYVWSPAADLYTDALCTVPYTAGSSAATVYAKTALAGKARYTCNASNTVTKCEAIDSVDVTTLPATLAAVAAPPFLCRSGTSTLSLGASDLSPARFQWAGSADDVTFTDIASATNASYTTPTLSTTGYFRAALKNSAGVFCLNSVSDTVRVLNPDVTGTVGGVRCGPGTVTLSASGDGGTLKWYTAATGGTALASGSPFITPSITATTTYYVSSEAVEITCKSDRVAVTATVNPLPKPTISPASGPILICAGNTASLTGGGGGDYQWRNASGHIPGANSNMYDATVAGNYRVVVTDPASGCKDSSSQVEVVVVPYPTVSIMPDRPLAICADSSQEYTSTTTGGTLSYQWYKSTAAITGATAATYKATETGMYTLRVSNGNCADTSNEVSLTVNPLPAASFTETDSRDAICMDDSLELTALAVPAGYAYQWLFNGSDISGATKRKHYAKASGFYSVRIRDANNCRKESDEQFIINTPMGIPDLLPKDVLFCEGATIKLYAYAGPYAVTYRWRKDGSTLPDTGPDITSSVTGAYEVTVTDVYGCTATSKKSSVTVVPLPDKPVITHTGSTLSVKAGYASYQWYRNGKIISGATGRTLALSFDGNYHVVVSNSSECYNTSDTIVVKNLAVEEVRPAMSIKLYPNPAQSIVYIEAPVPVTLLVRDQQGRRIAEVRRAQYIDMGAYAGGLYLFTFYDEQGQILGTQNIIKKTE